MERLTEKRNGTNVIPLRNAICGTDMPYWKITTAGDLTEYLSGNAADRLAAYEDTDLEPEEIKDFMSRWKDAVELAGLCKEAGSDHLCELAEADSKGLCNILPCNVGNSVWDLHGTEWTITQFEKHLYGRTWFRCGRKGTDDYMAFSDEDIGECIFLKEYKPIDTHDDFGDVLEAQK